MLIFILENKINLYMRHMSRIAVYINWPQVELIQEINHLDLSSNFSSCDNLPKSFFKHSIRIVLFLVCQECYVDVA